MRVALEVAEQLRHDHPVRHSMSTQHGRAILTDLCVPTLPGSAINSCCLKLSKLTVACKVWRGFTGAMLPKSFFEANSEGVKGGIEVPRCISCLKRRETRSHTHCFHRATVRLQQHHG